ncbi:hypothetical protein JOB18_010643 [Solea senegalensis]|uniref:Uncharacterized protein n=1 Tax=Solea senegalensis TaxID=28829 RepID=A0AAV6R6R6_SOLSE|nr:hypothetical protein JOB18_010643 [Solea senegalensis]
MDISVQIETEALKVLLLNKVSSMRRWWLLQDFELPRVDKWLNCSSATFSHRYPDAKFNYHLRDLFLVVLTWGVINIMLYHNIGPHSVQKGIILVELCAAVVFVTVMVKTMMETMGSMTPAKTDEVRSVSSPRPPPPSVVQHV